jgi:hypothetical protein
MSRTVFIAEVEDSEYAGEENDHFLTGRFHGHVDAGHRITDSFEDLSLDEALAWARERADRIVVRVGYGPAYAIGFESESRLPWPSEGLPQPVRRRTPDEEWKDRTDADPDATWVAKLGLGPPQVPDDGRRPEWDEVVAAVADELGAQWSAANLDGWFAGTPADGGGWSTMHSRQYEIDITVLAPTASRARETALARVPPLPDGWRVVAWVRFEGG